MSSTARLIAAMRAAAGARELAVTQWIELAQSNTDLRDAFRVGFGKRMPKPQRLGQWLTESLGTAAGEFILYGRHAGRGKTWRYCVRTLEEAQKLERQAQEAEAAREARRTAAENEAWRLEGRRKMRRERWDPNITIAVRSSEYKSEPVTVLRVDSDGKAHRDILRDRDGAPVQSRTESPPGEPGRDYRVVVDSDGKITREPAPDVPKAPEAAAAPKRVNVTERTANDPRLAPWVREGRQPTKAELSARHEGRTANTREVWVKGLGWEQSLEPVAGFADPGGIVSRNINAPPPLGDGDPDGWRYDQSANWTKRL